MNSTPKDRVLRQYPRAFLVGSGLSWTVYAEPRDPDQPKQVLGRGTKPGRAWLRASQRLQNDGPPPRDHRAPKAASTRGF